MIHDLTPPGQGVEPAVMIHDLTPPAGAEG